MDGVKLDVFKLSTMDWYSHNTVISSDKSTPEEKVNSWIAVFQKCVTECPEDYGKPGERETYLNDFIFFDSLIDLFWRSVADERKKAKKRPTTA